MVQSRCQGIMMTYGGMKHANTTDRWIRRKKRWWSMRLQGSDSKAIPAVVSPAVHLPVPLPSSLWSLWSFWGACSDARVLADILNVLCGGLPFAQMLLSGVYLLVTHQDKVDSFCHWPLLIDQEGSSPRSVNFRREWRNFNGFVLFCLRVASQWMVEPQSRKNEQSLLTEILWGR